MKERPILFSAPMVLALLAGTKTQTRRIVQPQPTAEPGRDGTWMWGHLSLGGLFAEHVFGGCMAKLTPCPYGRPGDRLWVRESIRRIGPAVGPEEFAASEFIADGAPTLGDCWPWKNPALPSIHCPRGLSRISLEVTCVRVERLCLISENDAKAEGCEFGETSRPPSYRGAYAELWERINGAGAWNANPWVWVIEFEGAIR